MEEAAVHAADGLSTSPALLAAVVILVALIVATVMIVREVRAGKEKQIEAEKEATQARLELEREMDMKRIEIEDKREARKAEETAQRIKDNAEMMSLQRQTIEATNRSTAAIEGMSRIIDTQNARLEMSADHSRTMGEQMQDVHTTVHAIDSNVQDLVDGLIK